MLYFGVVNTAVALCLVGCLKAAPNGSSVYILQEKNPPKFDYKDQLLIAD
jgi:hypothetical protein